MSEIKMPEEYRKKAEELERDLEERSKESNWERRNPDTGEQYCVHGTNIGTWDGPDLMCGACEDGISHHDYAVMRTEEMWQRDRKTVGWAVSVAIKNAILDTTVQLKARPLTTEEILRLMDPAMRLSETGDF